MRRVKPARHRSRRIRLRSAAAAEDAVSDNIGGGIDNYSLRQPLGVVAGITPFNFPAMVPMWMFPLALVCGNTFVLKPSERDPRHADAGRAAAASRPARRRVQRRAGRQGSGRRDSCSKESPRSALSDRRRLPNTSTLKARGTASGAGARRRQNHMIVMPDADLDQAADALIGAAYGSAGERAWRCRSAWWVMSPMR